jgi:hypothetical protein
VFVVIIDAHGRGSMFLGFASHDGIEQIDDRLSVLFGLNG